MIHDVGYVESGLTTSNEMIVSMNETIGLVKRLLGGIRISDDDFALDVIDRVGPGGHFLGDRHTVRHCRENWRPNLFDRQNRERWEKNGELDLGDRSAAFVREILESYDEGRYREDGSIWRELDVVAAEVEAGLLKPPLPEGAAIATIVPRHGQGTLPSLCLVTRHSLQRGAIASTVSHDSHNLVVLGKNPGDMLEAVEEIQRAGGGLTAVLDGEVLSTVPLPIAGLMTPLGVVEIGEMLERFEAHLPALGLPHAFPTSLLAIALPVIPHVRLTDLGLVDVAKQMLIPISPN